MADRRAEQLSPRDATLPYIGGALTYLRLHRYADALQEFDRSLTIAPDLYSAAFRRAHTFVLWTFACASLFAQARPDTENEAGYVPIISGGAGYIHNVSGGGATLDSGRHGAEVVAVRLIVSWRKPR